MLNRGEQFSIIWHLNNSRNGKCKYKMIQIELKLFVTLSKYLPGKSDAYDIQEGTTISQLITDLGIPNDIVKLIFINGKKQGPDYRIQHMDRVGLFPPVGGG